MRYSILKFIFFFFFLGHLVLAGWAQPTGNQLPVTIYYSLPQTTAQVIEGFLTEYRQTHPYLAITTRNFPRQQDLYKELTKGGTPPTIALMETSWLDDVTKKQTDFLPVETWMPRETFLFNWSVKCNCQLPLWEGSHVNGKLMALPYFFTTQALMVNPEVFTKAGIKAIPATWEDFAKSAKKLGNPQTANGLSALALSIDGNPERNARALQILNWQFAGRGLADPNTDATSKATELLKSFKPILAPLDGPNPNPHGVAAWIGNVEDYFTLKQMGLPIKVAPMPGTDKRSRMTETQGWSIGMFKTFPDKELYKVQELAFFLLDFPQQRRLAEQTPYLAAHVKVFDNPFYRKERLADHANLRVFLNSIGPNLLPDTDAHQATYQSMGRQLSETIKSAPVLNTLTEPETTTAPVKSVKNSKTPVKSTVKAAAKP